MLLKKKGMLVLRFSVEIQVEKIDLKFSKTFLGDICNCSPQNENILKIMFRFYLS